MSPDDSESHKNEGFLKSMWHTLTNHPAHQKPSETDADKSTTTDKKSDEKKDGTKNGSGSA